MTLTDERADENVDDQALPGVERIVWFSGGFLVALNLVVLIGLGVLAYGSASIDVRRQGDEPVAAGGAESVFVATEFAFDPSGATAPGGQLTITLVNEGAIFHNLLIEEQRGFVLETEAGATSSAPVELEEGVFTLYCSVPGHRESGMEATLTIDPS